MPQLMISRPRRSRAVATVLLLALTGIVLAACGGSSNRASSSATTSASAATTTSTAPRAAGAGGLQALRECLKKHGITLPRLKSGGSILGQPKGSKAQREAALKRCGAGFVPGRGNLSSRLSTPQARQALAKFAACLRQNGVEIGAPNTSGKGAIFNTKGINTRAPAFAAAETKCRGDLRGAFGATPGAAGRRAAPPARAGG